MMIDAMNYKNLSLPRRVVGKLKYLRSFQQVNCMPIFSQFFSCTKGLIYHRRHQKQSGLGACERKQVIFALVYLFFTQKIEKVNQIELMKKSTFFLWWKTPRNLIKNPLFPNSMFSRTSFNL